MLSITPGYFERPTEGISDMASTRTHPKKKPSNNQSVTGKSVGWYLEHVLFSLGDSLRQFLQPNLKRSPKIDEAFPGGDPDDNQWKRIAKETEKASIREFEKGNREVYDFYVQTVEARDKDSSADTLQER